MQCTRETLTHTNPNHYIKMNDCYYKKNSYSWINMDSAFEIILPLIDLLEKAGLSISKKKQKIKLKNI